MSRGRASSLTAAIGDGPDDEKWWEASVSTEDLGAWRALVTEDGVDYYLNIETNETQWEKPLELMSDAEINDQGEWLWVPSSTDVYIPAKLDSTKGDKVRVTTTDNSSLVVKKSLTMKMKRSYLQRTTTDLTLLDDLAAPLILHNLRKRFEKGDIYTNIGNILISINPYQRLPLYTPEIIRQYSKRKMGAIVPPHVYDIAHDSYYRLTAFSKNQSIIISGESGAGKTECTKQALQYLASVAPSTSAVESRIMSANPILEAFGNAKTLRNDNSSRFGKYMEIFFDHNYKINGAATQNYLLEKIRVVNPGVGERNFHIFYQLAIAAPTAIRTRLSLHSNPADYKYLDTCTDVPGLDDAREFKDVITAFDELQFTDTEREGMFDMVGAILALGNVTFREAKNDEAEVDTRDPEWINTAAKLLQIKPADLSTKLVTREIRVRGQEKTLASLNTTASSDSRHALSKFVYGRMFDWLVQRVNQAMDKTSTSTSKSDLYIGILDIFGFEIFKTNSFEQLCINYTNEMLQQHFNQNTFKLEEEIYVAEGITWDAIDFIDNEPMIELITQARVGILPMLDEELKVPGGSDERFLKKLQDSQGNNPAMVKNIKFRDGFTVKHFAGEVPYTVAKFMDKNRDTLTEDLVDMLADSSHKFLQTLYPKTESVSTSDRKSSLSKQFQKQLKDLMGQLYSTEPHYIRCIKPNDSKTPLEFRPRNCFEQLTYSGVFEAVAIRKKGFPFRLKHDDFVSRYAKLCPEDGAVAAARDAKTKCTAIAVHLKLEMKNVQIGRTLVLYRANEYRTLELKWSVVTKHETVRERVAELLAQHSKKPPSGKAEEDDFCIDLAYAVREASLFKITGDFVNKAKALLDTYIEKRMDPKTKADLQEAIRSKDVQKLRSVLEKCEQRGIEGSLVSECRRLVALVEDAEGALAFATKSMEEEHLLRALEMCDAFDYRSGTEAVARELLKNVQEAVKQMQAAFKKAPRYKATAIEKCVKFCKGFGYDKGGFHALDALSKKLKAARKLLNAAYDDVDEGGLIKAIKYCGKPNFNGTTYESTLVEDCEVLLATIQDINEEAKKAVKECIADQVETIAEAAIEINLRNSLTKPLIKLVEGPKEKFLAEQIRCAMNCKDVDRASRAQVALHDLEFRKNRDKWSVWKFGELKSEREWAEGKEKLAMEMKRFQAGIAHAPFTTRLDQGLGTEANKELRGRVRNGFETVQKCMGQRHSDKIPQRLQELGFDGVLHNRECGDEFYVSIVKQCTENPAATPGDKPNPLTDNCLERAVRLLAFCLTIFPPSKQFAGYLANWIRMEPIRGLGTEYNLCGLLARIMHGGAVDSNSIPREEHFDVNRVTYTKHWVGRTWNGDGLDAVLEGRLKLKAFKMPKWTKKNASWLILKQGRRPSTSKLAVLEDVGRAWEEGEGEGGEEKEKKKKKKKGGESEADAARAAMADMMVGGKKKKKKKR